MSNYLRVAYFSSRAVYKQYDGEWVWDEEESSPTLGEIVNKFIQENAEGAFSTTSPNVQFFNTSDGPVPTRTCVTSVSLIYTPKGVVVQDRTQVPGAKPFQSTGEANLSIEELQELLSRVQQKQQAGNAQPNDIQAFLQEKGIH